MLSVHLNQRRDSVSTSTTTNLEALRGRDGYSQRQLGEELGCSHNAVWAWESGRTQPSYETAWRLIDLFDVSVETLLAPYNGTLPPPEPDAEDTLPRQRGDWMGDGIRQWRRDRGCQQADLARFMGVGQTTISNWEREISMPNREHLKGLRELNVVR